MLPKGKHLAQALTQKRTRISDGSFPLAILCPLPGRVSLHAVTSCSHKSPNVASNKLQLSSVYWWRLHSPLLCQVCLQLSVSWEPPAHKSPCVTAPRSQETLAPEETNSQKSYVASTSAYTNSQLVCVKVWETLNTLRSKRWELSHCCMFTHFLFLA